MENRLQVVHGIQRLKGLFLEVPGTRLNLFDATRLSGLEQSVCEVVLDALEHARFLKRATDGCYLRTADSPIS